MRRTPCGYTVSLYADGRELPEPFWQSVSVPKRFFDTLKSACCRSAAGALRFAVKRNSGHCATFWMKRMRMAATCARVALPCGSSLPSEPPMIFCSTVQRIASVA